MITDSGGRDRAEQQGYLEADRRYATQASHTNRNEEENERQGTEPGTNANRPSSRKGGPVTALVQGLSSTRRTWRGSSPPTSGGLKVLPQAEAARLYSAWAPPVLFLAEIGR
jgi:hypothetical protein